MPANIATSKTGNARTESTKANLTIKLDKNLLRRVRVMAAEQGTSISALVAAKLEEDANHRDRYEEARKHALTVLAEGWDLGGHAPTREQMNER